MSILPIITIIGKIDIIIFVHMLVSNHRVYYLSSDMINESSGTNSSNKYRKTLTLNSFDEDYSHVSLLHAVIPNSFPTIQEDVNDTFIFVFSLGTSEYYKYQLHPQRTSISVELRFNPGFYSEEQILTQINDAIKKLKYSDFGFSEDTWLTTDNLNFPIISDEGSFLELDNYDKDQTNHLQVANQMNVIYNDNYALLWINKIEIITKDLSYKILGIPKSNYYLCYDNFTPENISKGSGVKTMKVQFPFNHLPYRPTLSWVSSISIRLDIVNIIEDSNVLENIPVTDPECAYITYQNNDILNTSKKFNNTYNNGQINIQITQQNGYELNLDNIEFTLDIVVFKV